MREKVLKNTKENGYIHLGLGCIMKSNNPDADIRTLFNACSQFWSIITLLTINKMHYLIDKNNYSNDIQVVSTIYDSIYFKVKRDSSLIKWVNDNVIEILCTDYLKDIIIHNEAEGEIGINWYDTVAIHNNASLEEIQQAIEKAEESFKENK